MPEIEINKIIRSKRRTFALEIAADASLIVRVPKRASLSLIQKIVSEKSSWIIKKQELIRQRHERTVQKRFVTGERFLCLGEWHKLNIVDNVIFPLTFDNDFYLSSACVEQAKELFTIWYKERAIEIITDRVEHYAFLLGLKYNKVKISNAQKRWGSCSVKGNLNFSWRLIMAPLEVIDYLVVHELFHLVELNHSSKFWSKVESVLPNYRQARQWLKDNSHLLVV